MKIFSRHWHQPKNNGTWSFEKNKQYFPSIKEKRIKILNLLQKSKTPVFIADKNLIKQRYLKMSAHLDQLWGKEQFLIAYSYKTNYKIAQSDTLHRLGVVAEVVSEYEYQLAKKTGHQGSIIFNGPYKTYTSLVEAAQDQAIINLDNFSDLKLATKLPKKHRHQAQWGIRLNLKSNYFPQGNRFGFPLENNIVDKAIEQLYSAGMKIQSIHLHQGSDISSPSLYQETAEKAVNFIKSKKLKTIKYLDFGGGFPSHGKKPAGFRDWQIKPLENYLRALTKPLKTYPWSKKPKIVLEPGRYLVDDAIIFVSRVLNVRATKKHQHVLIDGSLTMLPLVHYRPQIIKVYNPKLYPKNTPEIDTVINGASCKNDDQLFDGLLSQVQKDDLLIFFCIGAYNDSLSPTFIFDKPPTIFI